MKTTASEASIALKHPVKNCGTTSARRLDPETARLLAQLRQMNKEITTRAWAIGDVVNELRALGVTVKEQAKLVGASRQR